MLLLRETVLTGDGERLEVELHHDLRYRLAWRGVVYQSGGDYEFRSVEQLRYDFERHAAQA